MKKVISILMSLFLCIGLCTTVFATDTNLVKNGDFALGVQDWEIDHKDNTNATMVKTVEGMTITPSQTNGNWWELAFKQTQLSLSKNKKYRLMFKAKASSSKTIKVAVENIVTWDKFLESKDVSLTTSFQDFEYDFDKKNDDASQLIFHMGENEMQGETITFASISIIETGDIQQQTVGDWILNEADTVSAKLSGTNDKIQLKIDKVNNNWWDLTLKKDNTSLKARRMYQVEFDITSTKAGQISFDVENTSDYNIKPIQRTALNIENGKKSFSYQFVETNNTKESLAFHLSKGDGNTDLTGAEIIIENVKFTEVKDLSDVLILNGNFDSDTFGWDVYNNNGADLKINSVNNEGVLSFTNSNGNDYWDSQFSQKNIIVNSGSYRVKFDIKASQNTAIHFDVEDSNDYTTKYYPETVIDLTTDYQTMSFDFDISASNLLGSTKNIKLQYNVGNHGIDMSGQKIYIDNVIMEKISDASLLPEEVGEVTFDNQKIITEDFKGLGVQWDPYQVHPLTDEEWNMVTKRVDYLNPSFVRCMIYATTYCKGLDENNKPIYDFESQDMKALIKELDYLESRNIEVVLGEWEAPDRFKGAFDGVTVDSPLWSEMIVGLMDYLINEKGYTCIKYFNYVNEANTSWSYCGDYDKWKKGIEYLSDQFDALDISDKVKITGPDTVWDEQHTWLKNIDSDKDFDKKIGLYDVHMYPTIDEITNGKIEEIVKEQRASVSGKDFYMTEIGMVTGKTDGDSQPYTKEFSYGVIMADAAAQVMRGGLSGVAIWDLDDAMHDQGNGFPSTDIRSLKQWGFWNSIAGRVYNQKEEKAIRPHFYTWSLMTHLFPRHSRIIDSTISGTMTGLRTVGMTDEKGNITYMIVNDSQIAKKVNVKSTDGKVYKNLNQYNYFDKDRDVNSQGYPVINKTLKDVDMSEGTTIELPSGGVVFLSTLDTDNYVQTTHVEFSNVDKTSQDMIQGSEFELRDTNGKVVDSWTTTNRSYSISQLDPRQSYTLVQTKAVKGYTKNKPMSIQLKDTSVVQKFAYENNRTQGQIQIQVNDEKTGKPVVGVEYELRDINGQVLEKMKTNNQGNIVSQIYEIATFDNGQYQKPIIYQLVEVKTVKDYVNDKNIYTIQFDWIKDDKSVIVESLNIEKHLQRSDTTIQTSDSTMIYVFAALVALAGCGFLFLRRKK